MRDSLQSEPEVEWGDFIDFLSEIPGLPHQGMSHEITCEEWIQAVKDTKPSTARGICGFSQPELRAMHPCLIQAILDMFNRSAGCGLPSWLVTARTVLLTKIAGINTIPNMRPITIFSLLMRMWEKVIAKKLLMQWQCTLPSSVVGAVPGRSAVQLVLASALRAEHALSIGSEAGGFHLDISKCFNGIGRWPVAQLLKKSGMNGQHCDTWMLSLNNMSRIVSILGSISEPHPATTGLPEGCPLSVCGMIQLGYGWHCLVTRFGVTPSIFADDWAWEAFSTEQHILAMTTTEKWLKCLKLHSDPAKCWAWGSTKAARKAWSAISEHVTGRPAMYPVEIAAKHLGAFMHVSKTTQLGSQNQRLHDATVKLQRLARLSISIEQKARVIQSNVWPTAFYGIETLYVGQRHFSKLRSVATSTLLRKNPGTSTTMALACLTDKVVDPLVYVIIRILLSWRRMMILDSEHATDYRHILSQAHSDPNTAFGPAAALRSYLTFIGWDVNSHGDILDHLHRVIPLHRVSGRDIAARVMTSWGIHLATDLQRRQDFQDWPAVNIPLTLKIPFPTDQRDASILAMQRTVGHIFADQAQHWEGDDFDRSTFETCPLCGLQNSRTHFPYHCHGVAATLLEHQTEFDRIRANFPHCCFIPVAYEHPHVELIKSIHERRELPTPFLLHEFGWTLDQVPEFYTDGSSIFPELPGGQLAAFSIILDSTTGDIERIQCARAFRELKVWPQQLIPVQVALTPGAQTINRAELCAIIQIIRSCRAAVIYSDSAWAIEVFEAVRRSPSYSAHLHRANFDLICDLIDLASTTDLDGFQLCKVQSHQCHEEIRDDLLLFRALGNDMADSFAKEGTSATHSDLHRVCWDIAHWCDDQLKSVKHFSKLLIKMEMQRLDAFDKMKSRLQPSTAIDESSSLATWRVPDPIQICIDEETPDEFLAGFVPGASFFQALRSWCSMLRWNSEPGDPVGISYFELACNFVGVTGFTFPKVVERGCKHTAYSDVRFDAAAQLLHQSVWDLTRVLEHAIKLAFTALGIRLVPLECHQRKPFLRQYGYAGRLAGLTARPQLVHQDIHAEHMLQLAGPSGLALPTLFLAEPILHVAIHPLDRLTHSEKLKAFFKLHNNSRSV
eukprot:Skav218570  [mRNA]  locus=scaffold2610:188616:191990:- [translate_table: standard]